MLPTMTVVTVANAGLRIISVVLPIAENISVTI